MYIKRTTEINNPPKVPKVFIFKLVVVKKTPKMKSIANYAIKKIRNDLISRRGHVCELCHRNIILLKYLHMHHIDRNRLNNQDGNLLLLCATCHLKQHLDKSWSCKLLKRKSEDMEREIFSEFY